MIDHSGTFPRCSQQPSLARSAVTGIQVDRSPSVPLPPPLRLTTRGVIAARGTSKIVRSAIWNIWIREYIRWQKEKPTVDARKPSAGNF